MATLSARVAGAGRISCLALLLVVTVASFGRTQDVKNQKAKAQFEKILKQQLNNKEITADGQTELDQALKVGVEHLARDNFERAKMREAENSLKELVGELLRNARDRPINAAVVKRTIEGKTIEGKELKEKTEQKCPFYPWCSSAVRHPGSQ